MTTEQLRSSGKRSSFASVLWSVLIPIGILVLAMPFSHPGGGTNWFVQSVSMGLAIAAIAPLGLFFGFLLVLPNGWSPSSAAESAQTITLWLAAGMVAASVF